MTAVLMKRYLNTHVVTITFGCDTILNCFLSYLSNSYVSPNNGLNGFPTRSQFDVAMDIAKAVTYWNDMFGTSITQMKILRLSYHSCKCFTITNSDEQHLSFQGGNIQERWQNVKAKMRTKSFFARHCLNIFFRKKKNRLRLINFKMNS